MIFVSLNPTLQFPEHQSQEVQSALASAPDRLTTGLTLPSGLSVGVQLEQTLKRFFVPASRAFRGVSSSDISKTQQFAQDILSIDLGPGINSVFKARPTVAVGEVRGWTVPRYGRLIWVGETERNQ